MTNQKESSALIRRIRVIRGPLPVPILLVLIYSSFHLNVQDGQPVECCDPAQLW